MKLSDLAKVSLVKAYVYGDLSKCLSIKKLTNEDFDMIESRLVQQNINLFLTRDVLIKVLDDYLLDKVTAEQLSEWGKFIFYKLRFSNSDKYEPKYDAPISEVIMQLEWMGDKVDGKFTKADAKKAIEILSLT